MVTAFTVFELLRVKQQHKENVIKSAEIDVLEFLQIACVLFVSMQMFVYHFYFFFKLIVLSFVLTWNFPFFCSGNCKYLIISHEITKQNLQSMWPFKNANTNLVLIFNIFILWNNKFVSDFSELERHTLFSMTIFGSWKPFKND